MSSQIIVDLWRKVPEQTFFFGISTAGEELIVYFLNLLIVFILCGALFISFLGMKFFYQYISQKGEFSVEEMAKKKEYSNGEPGVHPLVIMILMIVCPLLVCYLTLFVAHNENNEAVTFTKSGIELRNNVVYVQSLRFNEFVNFNEIVDVSVSPNIVKMKRSQVNVCVVKILKKDGKIISFALRDDRMSEINLISCS